MWRDRRCASCVRQFCIVNESANCLRSSKRKPKPHELCVSFSTLDVSLCFYCVLRSSKNKLKSHARNLSQHTARKPFLSPLTEGYRPQVVLYLLLLFIFMHSQKFLLDMRRFPCGNTPRCDTRMFASGGNPLYPFGVFLVHLCVDLRVRVSFLSAVALSSFIVEISSFGAEQFTLRKALASFPCLFRLCLFPVSPVFIRRVSCVVFVYLSCS